MNLCYLKKPCSDIIDTDNIKVDLEVQPGQDVQVLTQSSIAHRKDRSRKGEERKEKEKKKTRIVFSIEDIQRSHENHKNSLFRGVLHILHSSKQSSCPILQAALMSCMPLEFHDVALSVESKTLHHLVEWFQRSFRCLSNASVTVGILLYIIYILCYIMLCNAIYC